MPKYDLPSEIKKFNEAENAYFGNKYMKLNEFYKAFKQTAPNEQDKSIHHDYYNGAITE